MKFSQMLIPTSKEVPAEAEIASHQLMIRAGLIRKLASGSYTYLPLGLRSMQKAIEIIRALVARRTTDAFGELLKTTRDDDATVRTVVDIEG